MFYAVHCVNVVFIHHRLLKSIAMDIKLMIFELVVNIATVIKCHI
jgi:hypothetical protein